MRTPSTPGYPGWGRIRLRWSPRLNSFNRTTVAGTGGGEKGGSMKLCFRLGLWTLLSVCPTLLAVEEEPILDRIYANEPSIPSREEVISPRAEGDRALHLVIQAAIDRLSATGGGTVRLEKGAYPLNGPIRMKSGVRLHLPEGARLEFSGNPADFLPAVLTRWEGTLAFNYSPMIYAFQARDIELTGKGIISGNGGKAFAAWRDKQDPAQDRLRKQGNEGVPLFARVYGEGDYLRPPLVQFINCRRVRIEGPTFTDSPFWIVHLVFSEYVVVRDIRVDSRRLNNDGVNPDSSAYVLIEESHFNTGDDAVAIKSGRDREGRNLAMRSENIVIRKNTFERVHNGVAIGSELSGGVRNIVIENCRFGTGGNLIYFKSNLDRGGEIAGVVVRDITVGHAEDSLLRFQTNYHSWRGGNHPTTFRDILVQDIHCGKVDGVGIWTNGLESRPLRNVVLKNITIEEAVTPVRMSGHDDVRFESVVINDREVGKQKNGD